MKYQMSMEDLNGFVGFIGAETKRKGDNLFFKKCPMCGNNSPKDDEYKFSVNVKTGAFGCLRGSCGYHGHFVELCRDFGYKLGDDADKQWVELKQPTRRIDPDASALAYLSGRGISAEIARRYQVTCKDDQPNILFFPFFDEYGKLVFMKYRQMNFVKGFHPQKEWCSKGTKPILFGMEVKPKGTHQVVITEGQLDSMSVAEAFKDQKDSPDCFCSVPMGCNGFSWVPHCMNWLKQFDEVIVFGDMEHEKMTLLDDLRTRLPNKILSVRKEDYLGEKDANDILRSFGAEAVRRCVLNAEQAEISHVKELADVQYVDITQLPKISTGVWELDKALKGGICFGQVCLLTGKRGDGKSTFMSQIMCDAIDQGFATFAYSGELPDFHFKGWLNCQLAGSEHMSVRPDGFGGEEWYLDSDTDQKISEWYRGRALIYDNKVVGENDEMESIIDTVKKVVIMRNVKLVCIDNLMTAMDVADSQSNLYQAQSNFVKQLKDIAMKYNVAIILVAHPRKAGKDENSDDFDNDVVSGSSNITDRVDIVLNYSRAKEGSDFASRLQIGKSRLVGILKLGKDAIPLNYSAKTKRVFGVRSMEKHYGWEKVPTDVDDIDVPF